MMTFLIRRLLATGCLLLTCAISPGSAIATCGEECDQQYSSDVDDCHSKLGDDPADAEDLASCIQDARDDYGSCVDDCAGEVAMSVVAQRRAMRPISCASPR
jgi:hypothetical protein